MRDLLAGAAIVASLLGGVAAAAPGADREVVTRFADPEITESSGLVVDESFAVTVNDSGDSSRIFTVDLATGETVGVTRWARESQDNEALAPAGDGLVWVGDIGDNRAARGSISVTRVPYGAEERTVTGERFELVYPDGPADAEALLVHPSTGRLHVVTKGPLGGTVHVAPDGLRSEAPNELRVLGDAPALVTDGAFLPSGDRVVLRNYGRVFLHAFPSMELLAAEDLPPHQQGEGLAVGPDGRVYLSSEGVGSELLAAPVPAVPAATPATEPAEPRPSPEASPTRGVPAPTTVEEFRRDPWQWAAGTALLVIALIVLVLSLRPR